MSRQPFYALRVTSPQLDGLVVLEGGGSDNILCRVTRRAQDDVGVAAQLLHDLFGLQIPNVDVVVFRSGHDPLAAGHGEVGEDAVLFVAVTRIRLEAFAFGVIPQLESVVQRGGEDVLAVRRELDKTHGRVVVVDQRFEALTRRRVPDTAKAVVTAGDDKGAVAIKVHGGDGVGMRRKRLETLSGADVPNSDAFVERSGHDEVRLRVKVAAEDVIGVT